MTQEQNTAQDTETKPNTKQFMGHVITLEPDWQFSVVGPEFDQERYSIRFKSYADARTEIDKRVSDKLKLEAKNIKFKATILDSQGNETQITGINRRTGNIVEGHRNVYPNTVWVHDTLIRRKHFQNEITRLDAFLEKVQISADRAYGYGRIAADEYPNKIKRLELEIQEKTKLAEEITESVRETTTPKIVA